MSPVSVRCVYTVVYISDSTERLRIHDLPGRQAESPALIRRWCSRTKEKYRGKGRNRRTCAELFRGLGTADESIGQRRGQLLGATQNRIDVVPPLLPLYVRGCQWIGGQPRTKITRKTRSYGKDWTVGETPGKENGGAERDRTAGLLVANEALSQLSYSPTTIPVYQRPRNRESRSKGWSAKTHFRLRDDSGWKGRGRVARSSVLNVIMNQIEPVPRSSRCLR